MPVTFVHLYTSAAGTLPQTTSPAKITIRICGLRRLGAMVARRTEPRLKDSSAAMIDLFSDTKTKPTAAMREGMAHAPVGDERANEDPSVNALVERCVALLAKEAAVYLPSGTMCNEIALAVH